MSIFVLFLFCLIISSCSGCIEREEVVYPNCYVNNIANAEISYNYLTCTQGDVIYYYDSNVVYRYEDEKAEALFETDDVIKKMACTSDGLYYVLRESPACDVLYKYDWEAKEVEKIALNEINDIAAMAAHGDDLFISEYGSPCYLIRDEEEICITDLIKGYEKEFLEWEEYVFHIICDDGRNELGGSYANDGWDLFLQDSECTEVSGVMVGVNNCTFTFDEEEKDFFSVLEDDYGYSATSLQLSCVEGEKIYLLYQYCTGPYYYVTNCESYCRVKDSIYVVDVNTQEMTLVYDTEDNSTQIGGFSIGKNEMYLVRLDGVYRCDMQGNNEIKIVDGVYRELVFETCNGKLFIYDASDSNEYTLLLID